MKLWDSLKNLWRKWTQSEYRGPDLTENQITDKVAEAVADAIEKQSKPFVRQVAIEANKAKVPTEFWPYVFWLIDSAKQHWPTMGAMSRGALELGRDVMRETGDLPDYKGAVVLPPADLEGTLDGALKATAFWAATTMSKAILGAYSKALRYWAPAMAKATEGELPPDKALPYLKRLFEAQLERNPGLFFQGDLISQWMFGVYK